MRLIENWKRALDENFRIGTVLMDLSKAFDCIPHDLLIAKIYAYGLREETTTFFYSYLKRREQRVRIEDILIFASFDPWTTLRIYPRPDPF